MSYSGFLRLYHFYDLFTACFLYKEVMSVGLYAIEQMRIFFIQEIIDKYAYTVIEPIGSKPGVLHG